MNKYIMTHHNMEWLIMMQFDESFLLDNDYLRLLMHNAEHWVSGIIYVRHQNYKTNRNLGFKSHEPLAILRLYTAAWSFAQRRCRCHKSLAQGHISYFFHVLLMSLFRWASAHSRALQRLLSRVTRNLGLFDFAIEAVWVQQIAQMQRLQIHKGNHNPCLENLSERNLGKTMDSWSNEI